MDKITRGVAAGLGVGVGAGVGTGEGAGGVGTGEGAGGVGTGEGAGLSQSELLLHFVTPSLPQMAPLPPTG